MSAYSQILEPLPERSFIGSPHANDDRDWLAEDTSPMRDVQMKNGNQDCFRPSCTSHWQPPPTPAELLSLGGGDDGTVVVGAFDATDDLADEVFPKRTLSHQQLAVPELKHGMAQNLWHKKAYLTPLFCLTLVVILLALLLPVLLSLRQQPSPSPLRTLDAVHRTSVSVDNPVAATPASSLLAPADAHRQTEVEAETLERRDRWRYDDQWRSSGGGERRIARDGNAYTYQEFRKHYGRAKEWHDAEQPERRYAKDGHAYTCSEFISWYGHNRGMKEWDTARNQA